MQKPIKKHHLHVTDKDQNLTSGTYEIIQARLGEQQADLVSRIAKLDEGRKSVFGGVDLALISNERISTDNTCKVKDLFSMGEICLLGHNTHLGLRAEIALNDVFSAFLFRKNRFEPQPIAFLEDPAFVDEFKNLYKYYRHTFFARFFATNNYLYFVFQLSESPTDIKAFKWLLKDNTLTFVDARSASEVQYPTQHEFEWTKATRDMQRKGKHPHFSLADKVFVESIGGDITIKVEDNTDTGLGIYSEDVANKDQTLDDSEIHFFDYRNLVVFKIKPYQETERFFIYNHKEKKVARVDSLRHSSILLPDHQGVIYPNGFALQTGELRVIAQEDRKVHFLKRIQGANGENFLFVFYDEGNHNYLLLPYNIIKQTIDTPIWCNGFTIFEDGKLAYIKADEETKNHLVQLWQTPFSKEIMVKEGVQDNVLYKIGNKDLVRAMADCQALIVLLAKKDSYSGLYNDIVKQTTLILDNYYFLGEKEVSELNQPLLQIRKIAHSAINEFEKVVEMRKATEKTIAEIKAKCDDILSKTNYANYSLLTEYIDALSQIRRLRGELSGAKDLKYADIGLIEGLEKQLDERSKELSDKCVVFLLQPNALQSYHEKADHISTAIKELKKAVEGKALEKQIDELALQLELLVDIVNNLKIEDTSHSTQIIESISVIFARLNQERIELGKRRREVSGKEMSADFHAQVALFDQAVVNFLELSSTPDKCDEFLTKLSIQIEEMETKYSDFEEFVQQIGEKREEVYGHFQKKRVQLTEARNKRTTNLYQSAERILKGVKNKAETFTTEVEINGYFASDLMVEKLKDIAKTLGELNDSAKSEEVFTFIKTAQQEAIRKLKDRNEIYVDGDKVIALGQHKFAVNKQKLDLTLVAKDGAYHYHLTGTSFYEAVEEGVLDGFKEVWDQEFVSENNTVRRFEYVAWQVFLKNDQISTESVNQKLIADFMSEHFGEGLVKGIHDADALSILTKLQQTNNALGLLRYTASERALAQLFWFFLDPQEKDFYEKQFKAVQLLKDTFNNTEQFKYLNENLSAKIEQFKGGFGCFAQVSAYRAGGYLKKEERSAFSISLEGAEILQKFQKALKDKGKDLAFAKQIQDLLPFPSACHDIVFNALKTYLIQVGQNPSRGILEEIATFVITGNFHKKQINNVSYKSELAGLKSLEGEAIYHLDHYEFCERLHHFSSVTIPKFKAMQEAKFKLSERKKQAMKLHSFQSQVLTSFVRNKLINEVYFPLVGANLSKQLGSVGETKRTDRMGMLLLVSPPGYGKTTLMEYLADRLGLVFMKINGPSIGHQVTSTDPAEAKNAGARQELEKLNLALEMGDNVMLYLDDIQHCNPEFLQKFISLADGQRKIEGIYKGEAKTYDLRSKRFCLVMAGNPYTESGEKFKIPDMLANRADTYNLGEISGSKAGLFELSLIENSLLSNDYLTQLTQHGIENLYKLYDGISQNNPNVPLDGNFSPTQVNDFASVLNKVMAVRETILKVNDMYIKSAAMSDDYRNEPVFKLQGSYRDMNKLVVKIQPIMTDAEVTQVVLNHYQNESQTLTSSAEANLLKLKELMGLLSEEEMARWSEIKDTFLKNKTLRGLGEQDRMAQVVSLLSQFSDGLKGISDGISNLKGEGKT